MRREEKALVYSWAVLTWIVTAVTILLALAGCTVVTEPEGEPCAFDINASTDPATFLRDTVPEDVLFACSDITLHIYPDGFWLPRGW